MGATGSKFELTQHNKESLLEEYHATGAISERNAIAGWTDSELMWLLTAFSSRCGQLEMIEKVVTEGESKKDEKKSKKDKEKKKDKKDHHHHTMKLDALLLQKDIALKHIVIFNQSFVNYPSLSNRFWNLLDDDDNGAVSFVEYVTLMYKIVRGSWEDRTKVAFEFFNTSKLEYISKEDVISAVTEISEFICNVARGLLTMKEFNSLKLAQIEELFKGTGGRLDLITFSEAIESHQSILSCSEILDMVFGRVIRKMEMDMKRDRVFGRHLQETALGNVKDISGEFPFVPEVIATSIHLLRKHNALGTPELFRISMAASVINKVKEELNAGVTLKTIFQRKKTLDSDDFMLLSNLIKNYCYDLKEPAFTIDTTRKIIAVQERAVSEETKIEIFVKLFSNLPAPNRYFLGALLPFLRDVSDTQKARGGDKCMNSTNLGVVFSPCTLFDPNDITLGAKSGPQAFATLIDNAELFSPVRSYQKSRR